MRNLTVIMAYYENPTMLAKQLTNFAKMDDDIRKRLTYIVVDDCSPRHPAKLMCGGPVSNYFNLKLFRMLQDVPWNQDACRNLAVSQADDQWLLITDMDHLPPEPTIRKIMSSKLRPDTFYSLQRVSAPGLEPYKPHPNSYVVTRAVYGMAGGYDERWAGLYGTDGMFRNRLEAVARWHLFDAPLIRYGREVIGDASTTQFERKGEANDALRTKLRAQIKAEGGPPKNGLSPWIRVI
jgi:hypothetical protein